MKNTTLLLILLICTMISSCVDDNGPLTYSYQDVSVDYVPGYAILLATSQDSLGIIKLNTSNNHIMKAVSYKYNEGVYFNAYQDIEFKIREIDGKQEAYDIRLTDSPQIENADKISDKISMNLHHAVIKGYTHPEMLIHKKGHIYNTQLFINSTQDTIDINLDGPPLNYGDKEYIPVRLCIENLDSNQNITEDCSQIYYMTEEQRRMIAEDPSKNFYFNHIEIMENDESKNLIIDILRGHVHFGDRTDFEKE